jgi:sulfite reductase (NADPH) flavoprotein alpha-component
MSHARPQHAYLKQFFGGRDMTLFHLKRMDSSDGSETLDDFLQDRLSPAQRRNLNEYLHEYACEYSFAGHFEFA